MVDKKKYYKLDDVGIVGTQAEKPAASKKYHALKTSAVFQGRKDEQPSYKKYRKKEGK